MSEVELDGAIAEVIGAIEDLPDALRRDLARGPLNEPECGVCTALTLDGFHARGDAAEVIVDWHRAEFSEKLMACAGMLGTTGRPTADEVERLRTTLIDAEGSELRKGIDNLAEHVGFLRCLFVYLLAGWKPLADLQGESDG